jgi:hypothetical protein
MIQEILKTLCFIWILGVGKNLWFLLLELTERTFKAERKLISD